MTRRRSAKLRGGLACLFIVLFEQGGADEAETPHPPWERAPWLGSAGVNCAHMMLEIGRLRIAAPMMRCGCRQSSARVVGSVSVSLKGTMARTNPASVGRRNALSSPDKSRVEPTSPNLRKSGIRLFGDTAWGTHMCMFYETQEDLLQTCSGYFEAGLERNELCVWAVSDPTTVEDACAGLRHSIRSFDRHQARGAIEILPGRDWYLRETGFDEERVISGWHEKLATALARGFEGVRISGNALWLQTPLWSEFSAYERALSRSIEGSQMLILCTYSLLASRGVDVLDVTRAHQCSVARRKGDWEFFQARELAQAQHEITRLNAALDVLSKPLPDGVALTPSERLTLSQIVRGASSKEAAQALGVSPRTVEFHRANIMRKLGARNIADLVRRVFGEDAYELAADR